MKNQKQYSKRLLQVLLKVSLLAGTYLKETMDNQTEVGIDQNKQLTKVQILYHLIGIFYNE